MMKKLKVMNRGKGHMSSKQTRKVKIETRLGPLSV
jgi:hypothetical protein